MINTELKAHCLRIEQLNKPTKLWLHDVRDQHVSKDIARNGIWEAYETKLFIERIVEHSNVIDVGANIGYYSVIAADQLNGTGYVAAFEPDFANFTLLQKNLQENCVTKIDAVHSALSDHEHQGKLYLSKSNFGDHQVYDSGKGREYQKINLINGTDYLKRKIDHIDLLKIDTQGAEYAVLSGLMPLLMASGDRLSMIIEFWPFGLRKAGASAYSVLDLLAKLNLPLAIIDHQGHQLLPCSDEQLRGWVDMVEVDPNDEGFMNILVGR